VSLLYVSDVHAWHRTPRNRVDDWQTTICRALEAVGKIAAEHQCEAVLLGGDLFHDTGAPCSLFNALYDIFKVYPCPIISAVGNHDMDNYNLDTWYTHSGLGSLVRSGVLLVEDVLEIGEDWRITTFHAGTEKAKLLISGGYNPLLYDGDKYEVAVAHIPVGPKSIGHIKGVNELYIPGFDVLCVADIHEQIPPTTTITGCIVVNPGPLERRSLTEKDLKCEVALIDNDLNVKYIPWGAPEANEVFRLVEDLEQEIGAEFFEVLREIREQPDQPLSEQIRDMAMHLGTTSAAFNLLLSEVGIG
jgi:hypothetical protein